MKQDQAGPLAGAFTHVVFKRLTAVEADAQRSNQHEFNGTSALRKAFGPAQPQRLATDFVWMPDDGEFVRERGVLTWYDSRARHPTRSEYRLYYRDNPVTRKAGAGDLLLIARRPDATVLLLMAPGTGLASARITWLFGLEPARGAGFAALAIPAEARRRLALEVLGAPLAVTEDDWAEEAPMTSKPSPQHLREAAARAQAQIGHTIDGSAGWDELAISLPTTAPVAIAGQGLAQTIRGVLARS